MNLFLLRLYVILICLVLLGGCGEYEEALRRAEVQEQNNRIARACKPEDGQRITVAKEDGFIHFTYIDIGPGRYSRTFPHVEVRVKEIGL